MSDSTLKVTVVATVLNEGAGIDALLDSLQAQTRAPDEIIICDAGSSDGTAPAIAAAAAADPRIRLIERPGNRSLGRNTAIAAATSPIIATIDGGCVADESWLERIVAPFGQGASWVAGFYRVASESAVGDAVGLTLVPVIEEVDSARFLPSARSMAFTKDAWERVGGFPEHLDYAEDTAFDEALKRDGHVAVFVPDAVVFWTPPERLSDLMATAYRWGRGDGIAGLRRSSHAKVIATWVAAGVIGVGAALTDVRLVPLAVVPLLPAAVAKTRSKSPHAARPFTRFLLPFAQCSASLASSVGFLRGWQLR